MSTLVITGWQKGFRKISMTKLIRAYTGCGMAEGKGWVDDMLKGKTVVLPETTRERAEQMAAEARELGAICQVETVEAAMAGRN